MKNNASKSSQLLYLIILILLLVGIFGAVAFLIDEKLVSRFSLWATFIFGIGTLITSVLALSISILTYKREEKLLNEGIVSDANRFINENNDEIEYIPLCIFANAYDNHHKYCRKIYNEFNLLNRKTQIEVLNQLHYDYQLISNRIWITKCLNYVDKFIEENDLGSSFLYDGGKYFFRTMDYPNKEYDHMCETQPIIDDVFHWCSGIHFNGDIAYKNKVSFDNYLRSYLSAKARNDELFQVHKDKKPITLLSNICNFGCCDEDYLCYWVMQIIESTTMLMIDHILKSKNKNYIEYSSGDAQIETYEDRFLDILLELYNLFQIN